MRTILRITLLGVFATSGIAIAIVVANQIPLDDTKTTSIDEPRPAVDSEPKIVQLPVPDAKPVEAPFPAPVANKIDSLEMQLKLLKENEQRERMLQLATKLDKFETAARQHQAQLEEVKNEQRRQLEDAARRQEAMLERFAQNMTTGNPLILKDPSGSLKSNEGEVPAGDSIENEGEGDDNIVLNLKGNSIIELLDFLNEEGTLNIIPMPSIDDSIQLRGRFVGVDAWSVLEAALKATKQGHIARREGKFVYIGTRQELNQMDLIKEPIDTHVFRTNYISAAELQKLIAPLLTTDPPIGSVTISSPPEVGIAADESNAGGDNFAGNELVVVRDYVRVLENIKKMIDDLDQRPRQVSIEAMILSVTLDDTHKFGINFEFLRARNHIRVIGNSPLANLATIDASAGGLNVGILDANMASFINALNTIGDTDVIASPHLSCLNKQRAEILIGDQKGYLSTTQTETATTQTVDFLDVGTKLRIRPFISKDGMVRLEVHPELSTGDVKLVGDFALPEKTTTQVTTNIMVPDGQTVVIGGLIREDITENISEVPVLGKIPLLGNAFRHRDQTIKRDEIIILLTPRIVEDPAFVEPGNEVFAEMTHRQATVQASKMTSIGKHHYSRRYYRLANSAWRAGNVDVALDYLELAIFFNPNNDDAMKLQGMILEDGPAPVEHVEATETPSSDEIDLGQPPPSMPNDSIDREFERQFERGGFFDPETRTTPPAKPQPRFVPQNPTNPTESPNQFVSVGVTKPLLKKTKPPQKEDPNAPFKLSLEDHSGFEEPELNLQYPSSIPNSTTQQSGDEPPMPASLDFLNTGK